MASARFFIKDFEKAKQLAAKENKLVLLLFSCGDGWGDGSNLEDQFDSAEFSAKLHKYYIPMRLVQEDYNYQKLYNRYKVQQIPSVIIVKPDGSEVDRIVDMSNYKKQYTDFLINSYEGKNTYADLKNSFETDPNNLEIAFKLFSKNIERGEIEEIVKTGKKILELEKSYKEKQVSEDQKYIFKRTRYHIRTSLFRFGKDAVLNHFSDFPTVKFSLNIYRFLAFTYSKGEQSQKADNFFIKAFQDFPDEYIFKKYYLKYCLKTKTQIEQATVLAQKLVNQKDFKDDVVAKIYEELKELKKDLEQ